MFIATKQKKAPEGPFQQRGESVYFAAAAVAGINAGYTEIFWRCLSMRSNFTTPRTVVKSESSFARSTFEPA